MPILSPWTGGGGYVECPLLSTRGGEGGKIGSKLVHVVVECPLDIYEIDVNFFHKSHKLMKGAWAKEIIQCHCTIGHLLSK